ncbi:hypothetical protein GCM10012275_62470 [Longimycelium tulufanense]|uniref:Uncharacterized protein n=2 Tax=Longimycelium tulufanense TaxID=907463 RepID=A0A8J3CKG0_9PSEU|nr:hypothetical protein GCM10012275_62470 [Longimycelium tulufanense]
MTALFCPCHNNFQEGAAMVNNIAETARLTADVVLLARDARWAAVSAVLTANDLDVAFDHRDIVADAVAHLRAKNRAR